ncbi:T9SS type A sorting domain-containing protein [Hymenobacter daeguensis]
MKPILPALLVLLLCSTFSASPALAQCTYRVVRDGNFNDPTIYAPQAAGASCSAAPTSNSRATIILDGYNVTLTSTFILASGGSLTIDNGTLTMASGSSIVVNSGAITVSSRGAITLARDASISGDYPFVLGDGTNSQVATNLLLNSGSRVQMSQLTVDKATVSIARDATLMTSCNLVLLNSNIITNGVLAVGGNLDLSLGGSNNTLCSGNGQTSGALSVAGCVYGGNGATTHLLNNCAADAISVCVSRAKKDGCPDALAAANTNEASCDAEAPSIRCRPLPVELVLFTATPTSRQAVALRWATASEKSCRSFTIERSADGRAFRDLRTVAGAGTVPHYTGYELTDEQPMPGISYYRLRQTDFSGTTAYSPVQSVKLGRAANETLAVYPGGSAHEWMASFALPIGTEAPQLHILDAVGRLQPVVATADPTQPGRWTLDTHQLPTGIYIVRLLTNDNFYSQRVAK